jgi:hypothetical protein
VDTERDRFFGDLKKANAVSEINKITDFHHVLEGRNGGGDPWRTDGALWVGILETH